MAFYTSFEGFHEDASGQEWSYVIGGGFPAPGAAHQPVLMSPGIKLTWDGDDLNYTRAVVGSSCEVTFLLTDAERAAVNSMSFMQEGDIAMFVFKSHRQTAKGGAPTLEWAGHLLIESIVIQLHDDKHLCSMTFTCGLASMKYYDFAQPITGRKYIEDRASFERILFRAFEKLPSYSLLKEWEVQKYVDSGNDDQMDGDWIWLRDIGVPVPLSEEDNPLPYDYSEDIISRLFVHSDTFSIPKEQRERRRNLFEEPEVVNTYDVIEDICKTIGCTLMWSGQGWALFNRTAFHHFKDQETALKTNRHFVQWEGTSLKEETTLDIYGDYAVDLSLRSQASSDVFLPTRDDDFVYTVDGATESRTLPLRGTVLTHEDSPADWIITEGITRMGLSNAFSGGAGTGMTPSGAMGGGMDSFGNRPPQATDQYAHRPNFGLHGNIFSWNRYNAEGSGPNPPLLNSIAFDNPDFEWGFPKRVNDQVAINGGQDLQYILEGNISFRSYRPPGINQDTGAFVIGGRFIIMVRIEVTDTNGTVYRLKRLAKVSANSGDDVVTNDSNNVAPNDSGNFRPIGYANLEWVASGGTGYSDAYYEIITPHGDNVDDSNNQENSLQTITGEFTPQGGELQPMYGGFCHEYDQQQDQISASLSTVSDVNFLNYHFREDVSFAMPGDSSNEFVKVQVTYRCRAIDRDATQLWRSGTDYDSSSDSDPTFHSAGYSQHYFYPQQTQLVRSCLRMNGGERGDNVTTAMGGYGNEVLNIGSSRIGSRFGVEREAVTGFIISGVYETNDDGDVIFNTEGRGNADNGYGFVNLQWEPWGNRLEDSSGTIIGPDDDPYQSLHRLICHDYLAIYGHANNAFQGRIIATKGGDSFFRPYQVFKTSKYSDPVNNPALTRFFQIMFVRYSWSMMEGSSYEGILLDMDLRVNNLVTDDFNTGGGGFTGGKPNGTNDAEYAVGLGSTVISDIDDIVDDIDDLVNDVDTIKDTTDFITVTGDVDLDDIAGLTTKLDQLPDSSNMTKPLLIQYNVAGKFATINDGTNGQVLATDGNGRYTFTTPATGSSKIVIASINTVVSALTGNFLYYGDRRGWSSPTWAAGIRASTTVIDDDEFINSASTVLGRTSSVTVTGIVRPLTTRNNVRINVYTSPPVPATATGTTLSLTRIANTTVSVSASNKSYAFTLSSASNLSISRGDLIWVMMGRSSTQNLTTADHLFSFTIITE